MAKSPIKPSRAEKFKAGIPGVTTNRERTIIVLRTLGVVGLIITIFVGIFFGLIWRNGSHSRPPLQNPDRILQNLIGQSVTVDLLTQLAIALGLTVIIALVGIYIHAKIKNGHTD